MHKKTSAISFISKKGNIIREASVLGVSKKKIEKNPSMTHYFFVFLDSCTCVF